MTDPGDGTINGLLDELVGRAGDRVAFVLEQAGRPVQRLSYGELDDLSRRVAGGLAERGVAPGDRILVQLPNSLEMLLCWFATARLGAIFVPSNTANTAREVAHINALSEPVLAVCRADAAEVLAAGVPTLARIEVGGSGSMSFDALTESERIDDDRDGPRSDDVAELVFTSGTTSAPKAAMITHANCVFSGLQKAAAIGLTASDHLLTALPFFHVNAQSATLAALTVGAPVSLLDSYSAGRYCPRLAQHGATVTSLVSMQVRTLLRQPPSEADRGHRVDRAWYALDLTAEERDEFEERFGIRLLNGYGLTEAFTSVCQSPLDGPARWPAVGLPLLGREVRTVDADGGDVPPGEEGEIIVRGTPGRTVMAGYWRDPAATERALRDGWLHTGDTGRLDEHGYLHFAGRKADLIKRAGENIAAGEVETVLLMHPAVVEAAVVGVPDPVRDEAVKAVIVLSGDPEHVVEEIEAHAREHLASFKVPTLWEVRSSLPKTSIGKVRKDLLRQPVDVGTEVVQ